MTHASGSLLVVAFVVGLVLGFSVWHVLVVGSVLGFSVWHVHQQNEIEGGSAAMETAVALQWRGGGSASAAAVAAAWRQRGVSGGSSTAGRAVAGGGG